MRGTTWLTDEDKAENHWRRTFCQIPFPAIYEHAENGKRSLHRLVAFFHRKAEAERSASEELRSVLHAPIDSSYTASLGDLEEHGSSVRRALVEVKNYVDATSHQQLLLARVLEEQVAEPLVSLQDASEMYIRTLQAEIRNVNTAYEEALQAHGVAAARLQKATDELMEARERQRIALHGIGVPAFELQRLAVRMAKCDEEVAQAELAKAQAKTLLYNRIVSRDEMAMAVSVAYQKAEEERLDQLHSCLNRFLHIEKERVKAADKMLVALEKHIATVSRAEDIQLLIHNHRNPDNMHFQGKALALLDWHWSKVANEKEKAAQDANEWIGGQSTSSRRPGSEELIVIDPSLVDTMITGPGPEKSPHGALAESPMSHAIADLFSRDSKPNTPTKPPVPPPTVSVLPTVTEGDLVATIDQEIAATADALEQNATIQDTPPPPSPVASAFGRGLREMVVTTCQTHKGRALFVKCLNRQRSLATRLRDRASFDLLADCFREFLDLCQREDDVKPAKTAMILAETFYMDRPTTEASEHPDDSPRRERGGSWGSLALHPPMARGATRLYLQEPVKTHPIWSHAGFWEKALLLAIGEELHRTPQHCAWEDLPSGPRSRHHSSSSDRLASLETSDSEAAMEQLPTREEAVSRVHNIVFGQLASFTLSMLEFDVPFAQIEAFVETMCDAHELTEDQRFLLRKNLQEVVAALK